jgi:hypothetical protein
MKAVDGWLYGLRVPLEYVEALFEHISQIIGFLIFGIAPLVILGCVIWFSWTHRRCILNFCGVEENNQTSNNISNQLSYQISNQRVPGSLPPSRSNENFYEAAPQTSNTPLLSNPTTINIHNNNIFSQIEENPRSMRPNPNCGHRVTARWPNKFYAMFEDSCFKFFDNRKWRHWDPKRSNIYGKLASPRNMERLQMESGSNIQNRNSV